MFSVSKQAKCNALVLGAVLFSFTQAAASTGISTPAGLKDVAEDLSGSYYLENSIDLAGVDFAPIGSPDEPFTGTFDGNGYQIINFSIEHGNYSGLFGCVGEDGVILNLRLADASIKGEDATGALAGLNRGAITDSFAIAFVSGGKGTGGLAGVNEGIILESYAMGSVSGGNGTGGAAGVNRGSITDSYARSSVSGAEMTGGFAGYNSGDVSSSYSTGYTTGAAEATGGFCGLNSGKISGSFWDIQNSGRGNSDGGSGENTREMQTIKLFEDEGWDFSATWNRNSTYNGGYPFLRWRWDASTEEDSPETESEPEPEPEPAPRPEEEPAPSPVDNGEGETAEGDEYDIICFIATAAYGCASSPEVSSLRRFRDEFISEMPSGVSVIRAYCRLGPPFARFAENRRLFGFLIRTHLYPLVLGMNLVRL